MPSSQPDRFDVSAGVQCSGQLDHVGARAAGHGLPDLFDDESRAERGFGHRASVGEVGRGPRR